MDESSEIISIKFKQALSGLKSVQVSSISDAGVKRNIDMILLELREANRSMSLLVRGRKRALQVAKNSLDRAELSRQNLLYEKRHLEATIEDTKLHESLYLTIPLEEGVDNQMDLGEHELMLHRLQSELSTRKKLSENLKSQQDSLELARSRLVLKRKELEKLRDQLEMIIKAADPFLNSHAKFFMDLEKNTTEAEVAVKKMPLTKLAQELETLAERRTGLQVYQFDELEAGEEDGEESFDGDSSFTRSPADSTTRNHGRFTSHIRKVNRRFAHAYILAELGLSEESVKLYFYHTEQDNLESLLVVKLEISERDQSRQESESILLSLPLDPMLLLTSPHESIIPGEAGHVPFRWLQSISGLVTDTSFGDSQKVLEAFFSSIEARSSNNMKVDS